MRSVARYLILVFVVSAALAQTTDAPPSTPQERKQIVELAKKLEQNPLDQSLTNDATRLSQRIIDVPDITVTLCTGAMPWIQEHYRYAPELAMVYTLSAAAYVIEHPEKDSGDSSWAGIQSALRAYQNIVKKQPNAKSRSAERLIDDENSGKLEKLVKQGCGPERKET